MSYTSPPNPSEHWGNRLFENSNDFDVVAKFNRDSGLKKLQDDANADSVVSVRYSFWAPDCSDAAAAATVRQHLEGGLLAKLAAKQVLNFVNPMKKVDCTFNGWTCVLLAACAMSHGSKALAQTPGYSRFFGVPDTYPDFVKAVFEAAYMQNDTFTQFRKALKDYQPGVPYDFGSKTKDQDRLEKLARGWTTIQATPCAFQFVGGLPMQELASRTNRASGSRMISMIGPMSKADNGYANDGCGSCGNKKATLKCARCKDQVYCTVACQKQDWQRHKGVCRTPEDAEYMEGNALFMNTFNMG